MSARAPRERLAIGAVLSAMALVVLDAGMTGMALPTIAAAFGETPSQAMLVVTAYQVSLLIGLLPCAHLADRVGYRRLFVAGVVLFTCASVLSTAAATLPWLVAARALQGLGGAAILALGMALLRSALGPDRLAPAIASNAVVVGMSSCLAPAAGALILSVAGWRWLFVAALPISLIVLAASRALPAVASTRRFVDVSSFVLYAAAVGGAVVAAETVRSAPFMALAIATAALAAAGRLIARRHREAPLVPFDLLALRRFRKSVLASMLLFTGQSAALLALPFHLQFSLGQSIVSTGFLIALWPLAVAATSRVANRLTDRFSPDAVCTAGGIVLGMGLAAMALLPAGWTTAPLVACALVCGAGFGLFQVPNNRNLFLSAPAHRSAAAGGLQGTARLGGQTSGALIVTFMLSAAPLAYGPRLAIGLAAAAAMASAMVSWQRKASGCHDLVSPDTPARARRQLGAIEHIGSIRLTRSSSRDLE